jgi:hypothetical protein
MAESPTKEKPGDSQIQQVPSTYVDSNPDEAILSLARQITNISTTSSRRNSIAIPRDINPFIDFSNPKLNPNNPDFDPKAWSKHFVNLKNHDPERFPTRKAGISFKNLGVYGHGTGYDYQKNVINIIQSSISYIMALNKKKEKIQILRDFNGVVKPGETCVVLGRPGR